MVIVLNLNMAIDKTFYIDDFSTGKTFRKNADISIAGGKGVNVSRALKTLGIEYKLFGICMGFNGKLIIEKLKREKIENKIVYQKNGESRNCITVVNKKGLSTDINEEGERIKRKSYNLLLKSIIDEIPQSNGLCISGRSIKGIDENFYGKIVRAAKKKNLNVYLDITGRFLKKSVEAGADTVKINSSEFLEFSNKTNTLSNIEKTFNKYKKYGLKRFIVTDGPRDIIAVSDKEVVTLKPPVLYDFVSAVGAGDSFMAGLIYSDIQKFNFKESILFATACSISDCKTLGAGIIDKNLKDIIKISKRLDVLCKLGGKYGKNKRNI